jgi:hypothetical protein
MSITTTVASVAESAAEIATGSEGASLGKDANST